MHVHRRTMLLRQRLHRFQRPVRTPVQVARRELDPGAFAVLVLRAGVLEESELLVERQRVRLEKGTELGRELAGQAAQELGVALVDDPVLVTQRIRERHPHADVAVGVQHPRDHRFDMRERTRHPDLKMLHGSDPGLDHLECGVQRVEVGVDGAACNSSREPELEGVVARPELDRGQADVVMAVDEPRDDDVGGGPDDRVGLVPGRNFVMGADVDDDAVALEDGAVLDDHRFVAVDDSADHVLPANQRRRHGCSPQAFWWRRRDSAPIDPELRPTRRGTVCPRAKPGSCPCPRSAPARRRHDRPRRPGDR